MIGTSRGMAGLVALLVLAVVATAGAWVEAQPHTEDGAPDPRENGAHDPDEPYGDPLENGRPRPGEPGGEPLEEGEPAPDDDLDRACPAPESDTQTGDPLACYVEASDTTGLLDPDALRLCRFAPSRGPIECYRRAASETTLLDTQSVELCQCASDARPVDCVHDAERETLLNQAQILDLCRATHLEGLYRDCQPLRAPYEPGGYP